MAIPKYCYHCKCIVLIPDPKQDSWLAYCCLNDRCFYYTDEYADWEAEEKGKTVLITEKKNGCIFSLIERTDSDDE